MIKILLIFYLHLNQTVYFYTASRQKKKNRIYPDDQHAFFIDAIEEIVKEYLKYLDINNYSKKIKKVSIFKNEFKF